MTDGQRAKPRDPLGMCQCGHMFMRSHRTPGTECAEKDCDCSRFQRRQQGCGYCEACLNGVPSECRARPTIEDGLWPLIREIGDRPDHWQTGRIYAVRLEAGEWRAVLASLARITLTSYPNLLEDQWSEYHEHAGDDT